MKRQNIPKNDELYKSVKGNANFESLSRIAYGRPVDPFLKGILSTREGFQKVKNVAVRHYGTQSLAYIIEKKYPGFWAAYRNKVWEDRNGFYYFALG